MDIIHYFPPKGKLFSAGPTRRFRGNIVGLDRAQEKSLKQEGRGQGTTFERMIQPKGIAKLIKIKWVQDGRQADFN